MKRSLVPEDKFLRHVKDIFPQVENVLDDIDELDLDFVDIIRKKKRFGLALYSEPVIRSKILRICVRNQFNPSTADEKAHFLISIEGYLLDKSAARHVPFGNFFERIRVQLDRRFHPINWNFEWSSDSHPAGSRAHCFRLKAYGDKAFLAKIFLIRAGDVKPRFEVSPQLKVLLPGLPIDPTEEDVLLAMYQYIQSKNLLDERKYIRCNTVRCL